MFIRNIWSTIRKLLYLTSSERSKDLKRPRDWSYSNSGQVGGLVLEQRE